MDIVRINQATQHQASNCIAIIVLHFSIFAGVMMMIINMDDHDGDNVDGKYHDDHMMYDSGQRFSR